MSTDFNIVPKLPAIDLEATRKYFEKAIGFTTVSRYPEYLIMKRGSSELHFFEFRNLDPLTNYAMVYVRVPENIDSLYLELERAGAHMHPNGKLETKPWGVREFAVLDPNHTLLTFGQFI